MSTVTDSGVERWLEPLLGRVPGLGIIDAHTHVGVDADGTVCDPARLTASLDTINARAVTFPLHVEGGYARDNESVIAAAAASGDQLVPFCRLDPDDDPAADGARAIAAGARGIKLHPRAEQFTLVHPGLEDVFALAHQHHLPVLIHAGRGIEPLGTDALRLASAYPHATLILAHACITDLAWIGEALLDHPNILFDTSWFMPADLLALFATVPPGRILFASDMPYGDPALIAFVTLRCAMAVGLEEDQIRSVMGGQLKRLLDGRFLPDFGPAPGSTLLERDLLLDRATHYIASAWGSVMSGGTGEEMLALARMSLDVSSEHPHREICEAALEALDAPPHGPRGLGGAAIAAALLATPGVPV